MTNKQRDVILRFMTTTIEKVNSCLAGLYTIQKIMIQKEIITREELLKELSESQKLPQNKAGKAILEEMLKDLDLNKTS